MRDRPDLEEARLWVERWFPHMPEDVKYKASVLISGGSVIRWARTKHVGRSTAQEIARMWGRMH